MATSPQAPTTRVHLVDGTYELFRLFYGLRRFSKGEDRPFGAVIGVLQTVLQMIENRHRLKALNSRDVEANSMLDMFDFTQPPAPPYILPLRDCPASE